MKRKYYKFTKRYCESLFLVHTYSDSVKEYIEDTYEWRCCRKALDCAKHLYHHKYDVVLERFMDVRRARRVVYNPKLFEEYFEDWCCTLENTLYFKAERK